MDRARSRVDGNRRDAATRQLPAFDDDGLGAIHLSRREIAVLELTARGETNIEIAKALGISPFTVKKHLERMRARIGVENRAALVAFAWTRARDRTGR